MYAAAAFVLLRGRFESQHSLEAAETVKEAAERRRTPLLRRLSAAVA